MNLEPRIAQHLILPAYSRDSLEIMQGETIADFLERAQWKFNLPTICVVNGEPVLRSKWSATYIYDDDTVYFLSKPHLGGGSGGSGPSKGVQVAALVGLIALAAIAPWFAGSVLGLASGSFGFFLAVSAITIGGGLLLSTFLRPKTGDQNNVLPTDQIYSLTASGNTAKPFQNIPVQYGRLLTFPDFVSTPWSDIEGQDLFLCVTLNMGLGKYYAESVLVDDVELWNTGGYTGNFTDTQIAFYQPGQPVTLFPVNIRQSPDVNNFQLAAGGGLTYNSTATPGPWTASVVTNDPGTQTDGLNIDLIFPGGLYRKFKTSSTIYSYTCHVEGEFQEIDNAGSPIGAWIPLFDTLITLNSQSPTRYTIPVPLPASRYQIRIRRYGVISTAQENPAVDFVLSDDVLWASLRANIVGPSTFDDISVLAIRMKATSQLTQQSARKFGILSTRILPIWDGAAWVDSPTRNPFWAFHDAAHNSTYGAGLAFNKIDLSTIISQAAAADTRGDTFNFRFDQAVVVPEAFDRILGSARAKHAWAGDILSCVRDEFRPIPQMLLSDQQIERGSLQITYSLNDTNQSDCVTGQFLNEATWGPASLQYPPNSISFTGTKPTNIKLEGITNEAQAYRETAFYYLQALLRRQKVQFNTEHDGRVLKFGSVIKIQSFLPRSWGQSGEILSSVPASWLLTANHNLTWDPIAQNYLELRNKRGRYWGPVKVTRGSGDNIIHVDSTDAGIVAGTFGQSIWDALDRLDGSEPPSFVLGGASELSRTMIVLRGTPSGEKVTIQGVVDNPEVHTGDLTTQPPLPIAVGPTDPNVPVIQALRANFRQGIAEPIIDVAWAPAPGAVVYEGQISYDAGSTWLPVYSGTQPQFSSVVTNAAIRVRVSGQNSTGRRSGWVSIDIDPPTITVAPGVVDPASFIAGLRDYVMTTLGDAASAAETTNQLIAAAAAEQDAHNALDAIINRTVQVAQFGSLTASITTVASTVVTNSTAIASLTTTVAANTASITTNATAIATVSGDLAARYTLSLDVNGYVSGYVSTNNGTVSTFTVITDNFLIARPASGGAGAPTPVFTVGTVSGSSKLAMRGDMLIDGDITTRNIAALSITAGKIAANSIDATKIVAGSISTTEIAVGGVDLLNIVANAATKVTQFNGSTGAQSGSSLITLLTGTFTAVGGNCHILGFITTTDSSFGAATNVTASYCAATTFHLVVDGSDLDSFTLNNSGGSYWNGSTNSALSVPAAWTAALGGVISLSAGSHTVQLKVLADHVFGLTANYTVNRALAIVFESRR